VSSRKLGGDAGATVMKCSPAILLAAILLASCASSPSSWQRPGTTEDVTNADITSCRATAAQNGYGAVTAADYLQRCMEAKGYRPSF
jgi:hypothetical protein